MMGVTFTMPVIILKGWCVTSSMPVIMLRG